jgi:hypothetical protein
VSEEEIHPEERQVKGAKSESHPKRSQRSMRFHDSPGVHCNQVERKYAPVSPEEPVARARI